MIIILITCIIITIYVFSTWTHSYWKNKGVKYIEPLPLFGNMFDIFTFKKALPDFFQDIYHKYNDKYVGIWSFRRPALIVKDPGILKSILIKDFDNFRNRSNVTNPHRDPLGSNNLFFMKEPAWKSVRAKLSPFFTSSRMKSMFELLNKVGNDLVDYVDGKISDNQCIIEVKQMSGHFTTDSIASIAFGVEGNSFKDPNSIVRRINDKVFDFGLRRGLELTALMLAPDIGNIFNFHVFNSEVSGMITKVFHDILEEREKSKIQRNDFVTILNGLRNQNIDNDDFSIYTMVGQAATFLTAGYETASSTISFSLYELAKSPEIQDKLSNEIDEVLKENDGTISYDVLQKMTYLDMCVKETLRKYPPFPFLDRVCEKSYRIPDTDLIIDPNIIIYVPIFAIHMDPVNFPKPEVYDPDRFSPENTIKPCTYMPFGAGPRNCIGERLGMMNTKIGLTYILKNFKIEICEKTAEKLIFNPRSTFLNCRGGVYLKFTKK